MSKSTDSLWQVFVIIFCFRKSVEKVCVSWALPLIECVAVCALKLPEVSATLRSLQNRSPLDFLQHIPTYSKPTRHKVFLLNYCNPNKIRGKRLTQATAPLPISNRFPRKIQKELPSPHKATSSRPNTHRKPIPKTTSPSSIRTVAKFFGVCKSTENFVLSGYKHMGIWHVSLTCRYPYAFV